MKRHKDLIAFLRSRKLRITPLRRMLLQFFLDREQRSIAFSELQDFIAEKLPAADRSTVYRNVELFKELGLIQELKLPRTGKSLQYVFDRKVHHYFTCKVCGNLSRGNELLFRKIEAALQEVHGFQKANLSLVFYGQCRNCSE